MAIDFNPVDSFGYNYRDNGENKDNFSSTIWKISHYIPGLSTFVAIFDLYTANKIHNQDYMSFAEEEYAKNMGRRAFVALIPGVNLLLLPVDIFVSIGNLYQACLTAD